MPFAYSPEFRSMVWSSPEQAVANNSTVHVVSDLPGAGPGEESERRTV